MLLIGSNDLSVENLVEGQINKREKMHNESKKACQLWSLQVEADQAQKKLISALMISKIEDAIGFWTLNNGGSLSPETLRNYKNYLIDLIKKGIVITKDQNNQNYTVEQLPELYLEICNNFETYSDISINEKRYRFNAFAAFTNFLAKVTNNRIPPIVTPLTLTGLEKITTPITLNLHQYRMLINAIKDISIRDYLVVNLVWNTGRNLNQILKLETSQLNFSNRTILLEDGTTLILTTDLIKQLREYIDSTELDRKDETVFITRAGKPVYRTHFQHILDQASESVNLGFKVTMTMIQLSQLAKSIVDHQNVQKALDEFKLKSLPKTLEAKLTSKHR